MLALVFNASGEVCTQCTLLLVDQYGAATSGSFSINGEIAVNATSFELVCQGLSNLIISNASKECALSWVRVLKHVVCSTDRVKR